MPVANVAPDFIVNTTTTGDQFNPRITTLADGRFVEVWTSATGDGAGNCVRGRIFNADGSPASLEFAVNTTTAGHQQIPEITALPDGRFVASWQSFDTGDGSGPCIRARIYNASGTPAGNDFIVNSTTAGNQSFPALTALADNRFVAVWTSDDPGGGSFDSIRARLYNADGTAAGDDFIVNTTSTNSLDPASPKIETLPDGRMVVVWYSGDTGDGSQTCIRARLLNASGAPVGNDFIVNTTAAGSQLDASVAVLSDGRFVISWDSTDTGDGSLTCVRARLYNADGSPSGNDFMINTTAANEQYSPVFTALTDGRFVAVWTSFDTGDGSSTCIRARLFNSDGTPSGDDFIVDNLATATNGQFSPDVTALADGRFAVAWHSDDTGDGSGSCIRTAIFDAKLLLGTVLDDNYRGASLNDTISGDLGNDTLAGGGGNDILFGDFGNDSLLGDSGADTLNGGLGADILDGGTGADSMLGGSDDDIYFVDNAGDQVVENSGGGYDIVIASVNYTLTANVEQLVLRGGATIGTGDGGANYLYGGASGLSLNLSGGGGDDVIYAGLAGHNTLSGGSGVDTLLIYGGNNQANGGFGNDIYYTYTATDTLSEAGGDGIDTVYANWNITLGAGFEQLLLFGSASVAVGSADNNIIYGNGTSGTVNLFGLDGADVLFGGVGNDTLSGGNGNDQLLGLDGANLLIGGDDNDVYYIQSAGNTVVETLTGGFDSLYSNVDIVLAENVEQLILYGAAAQATGSSGNDYIYGNASGLALVIDGAAGNDYILGSAQNDTLIGGLGNDQIDLSTGGNDRLRYFVDGNQGGDFVYGFNDNPAGGQDIIDITGRGYNAGQIGTAITIVNAGGNTLVSFVSGTLAGTSLTLIGNAVANVNSTDFLF